MLRPLRVAARRTTICTRWLSRPQQSHHHYRFHRRVYSNYAPRQPPPIYSYAPPSRWSRLKDMAIGSALTISLYLVWKVYDYRQFARRLAEHTHNLEEMRQLLDEFDAQLAEARDAGDELRMREILFERQRRIVRTEENDIVEIGPLPGFPVSHELHAEEQISAEDTLMFIDYMDGGEEAPGGDQSPAPEPTPDGDLVIDKYTAVCVVVNADGRSPGFGPPHSLPGDIVPADPRKTKLQELLWRLENQVKTWRKDGTLGLHEDLVVVFVLRDIMLAFLYVKGEFQNIGPDSL